MPRVEIRTPSFPKVVVDFLGLNIKECEVDSWRNVDLGQSIEFTTKIRVSNGPFPGLEWWYVEDENRFTILIGTEDSHFVP